MKRLPISEEDLRRFCERHGIRRLSLFGSTLKGTAREDSDIDLLVEFEAGRKPGLLGMAAMEEELSSLLGGSPVDLRTAEDLSRYFRDEIPWRAIAGMRHRIVHAYWDIDADIVWKTAVEEIPALLPQLRDLRARAESAGGKGAAMCDPAKRSARRNCTASRMDAARGA